MLKGWVENDVGDKVHYVNDEIHGENGRPAFIGCDGNLEVWYWHNKIHRIGAPAKIMRGVEEVWYFDGEIHREDGPAYINYSKGVVEYYLNGFLLDKELFDLVMEQRSAHKESLFVYKSQVDDSASGSFWFKGKLLHREDGPAVIFDTGIKIYALNGVVFKKEEFFYNILNDKVDKNYKEEGRVKI